MYTSAAAGICGGPPLFLGFGAGQFGTLPNPVPKKMNQFGSQANEFTSDPNQLPSDPN